MPKQQNNDLLRLALVAGGIGLVVWQALKPKDEPPGDDDDDDGNGDDGGQANLQLVGALAPRVIATGSRGADVVGPGEVLNIDNTVQIVTISIGGTVKNFGTAPAFLNARIKLIEVFDFFPDKFWFWWEPGEGVVTDFPESQGIVTGHPTFPFLVSPGQTFGFGQGFQIAGPAFNPGSKTFWKNQGRNEYNLEMDLLQTASATASTGKTIGVVRLKANQGSGFTIWYQDTVFAIRMGQCPDCHGPALVVPAAMRQNLDHLLRPASPNDPMYTMWNRQLPVRRSFP